MKIKIVTVSEELNSVETGMLNSFYSPLCQFQKNLIVWKLRTFQRLP